MPAVPVTYPAYDTGATFTVTGPGTLYTYTGATNVTDETVWANWNRQWTAVGSTTTGTVYLTNVQWTGWNTTYMETAEQAAAREAAAEANRERAEAARLRMAVARARAEELLLALLSDEQTASRREHGWFAVRGSQSGRVYRIHNTGISDNVDRLGEDGRREMVYCAHPPGLPPADVHLAQLLQIAANEPEFLRVANAHRPSDWTGPQDRRAPLARHPLEELPVQAA